MSVSADNPVDAFVHRVMTDERLLNRFRSDPAGTLDDVDIEFDDDQREALLSRETDRVREVLGEAQAHFVAVVVVVKRS